MVKRLVVGMSGASGAPLTVELLACPSFPGHKEQVVCERWACSLSEHTGAAPRWPVVSIYDNAEPEQIEAVLRVSDELLQETLAELKRERQR